MNRFLAILALTLLAAFGAPTRALAKALVGQNIASGGFAANYDASARFDNPQTLDFAGETDARGYEIASGRSKWPNRDPIGEVGRLNLYGMVGNDPVNRWDFLGLQECHEISDAKARERYCCTKFSGKGGIQAAGKAKPKRDCCKKGGTMIPYYESVGMTFQECVNSKVLNEYGGASSWLRIGRSIGESVGGAVGAIAGAGGTSPSGPGAVVGGLAGGGAGAALGYDNGEDVIRFFAAAACYREICTKK